MAGGGIGVIFLAVADEDRAFQGLHCVNKMLNAGVLLRIASEGRNRDQAEDKSKQETIFHQIRCFGRQGGAIKIKIRTVGFCDT